MKLIEKPLTTGQVAKYCGVTLRTVINWINKGILEAHQIPGTRRDNRILPKNLVAFMEQNRLPVPEELLPLSQTFDKGLSALVVDDDTLMCKALQRVLERHEYTVSIATNGFDAGLLYERLKPKLLVLDLQMPRVNGFQVLEQIQGTRYGKIIVLSGMEEKYRLKAEQAGADIVLAKPFEEQKFIQACF